MTSPSEQPPEVTVRYWAAARDAAGCASESVPGRSLADVIAAAGARHGAELSRLLGICSFIVGDLPVKRGEASAVELPAGSLVEVLPPFAGGSGHPPG